MKLEKEIGSYKRVQSSNPKYISKCNLKIQPIHANEKQKLKTKPSNAHINLEF
jgi:hypothetical protein